MKIKTKLDKFRVELINTLSPEISTPAFTDDSTAKDD